MQAAHATKTYCTVAVLACGSLKLGVYPIFESGTLALRDLLGEEKKKKKIQCFVFGLVASL